MDAYAYEINESEHVITSTKPLCEILDTKYKNTDLKSLQKTNARF